MDVQNEGRSYVGYGFPNMSNSKNGRLDPVVKTSDYRRDHKEHNRNFPDQKTSWFRYFFN